VGITREWVGQVGGAAKANVFDGGWTAQRVGHDVIILEHAPRGAAVAVPVDIGASAAVPLVDHALDLGRDVAGAGRSNGAGVGPGPVGQAEPLALQPGDRDREDPVEDLGQVAVGDPMGEQLSGPLDLV